MYKLITSERYTGKFANELRDNDIEWKFNPPTTSHFGGIWESNMICQNASQQNRWQSTSYIRRDDDSVNSN